MKKLILFILCLLITGNQFILNAQAGASIVYDPKNGASLASMLATIKEMKDVQEEWKASNEFLGKIASIEISIFIFKSSSTLLFSK